MARATRSSTNPPTWQQVNRVISVAASVISLIFFIRGLIDDEYPTWIVTISGLLLFACLLYLFRRPLLRVLNRVHPHAVNANPWIALVLLGLTALILWRVSPSHTAIYISFDPAKAAVFNSWRHQDHTKHIAALGSGDTFTWITTDKRNTTGSFRFTVNPTLPASTGASSGGYVTFYGNVCDKLRYRTVRFRCKVTDVNGNPDVGLRLAVDNPKATGDKELIAYEIASLAKYGPVGAEWRTFEIPLGDFNMVRYEPPFPTDVDENTINKIVFFVDNRIAEQCKQAAFHFSEICFRP